MSCQTLRNEGRKARKQILESVSTVRDLVHLVRADALAQGENVNPSISGSARMSSVLSGSSLSGVSPIKMRTSSFDVADHDVEYNIGDKVRERESERQRERERERVSERERERVSERERES